MDGEEEEEEGEEGEGKSPYIRKHRSLAPLEPLPKNGKNIKKVFGHLGKKFIYSQGGNKIIKNSSILCMTSSQGNQCLHPS